jgi:sensory rhodopsin
VGLYRILPTSAAKLSTERRRLFDLLQNHVGLLWIAYPVVWLVGPPGLNLVAPAGVEIIIPYLDVVAKVPYVYFIYVHRRAFTGGESVDTTAPDVQMPAGAD